MICEALLGSAGFFEGRVAFSKVAGALARLGCANSRRLNIFAYDLQSVTSDGDSLETLRKMLDTRVRDLVMVQGRGS